MINTMFFIACSLKSLAAPTPKPAYSAESQKKVLNGGTRMMGCQLCFSGGLPLEELGGATRRTMPGSDKRRLRFRDRAQHPEKFWKRNTCRIGTQDFSFTLGAQSSDAESHGDAMVPMRVNLGAVQPLISGHAQTIGVFFNVGAHGPEALRHSCNAV